MAEGPYGSHENPVSIRLECKVMSVDCESGVLTLVNGDKIKKDLIVLADGRPRESSSG